MTFGIDLSVLQSAHRMRGIGSTTMNFINNIPPAEKANNKFVFFIDPLKLEENPLNLVNLKGIEYEVRHLKKRDHLEIKIPGPNIFNRIINALIRGIRFRMQIWLGTRSTANMSGVDFYIQFIQDQPLPSKHQVKSIIVAYDIIPYILESDYLWTYRTSRQKGCSVKGSILRSYRRRAFKINARLILNNAYKIIAISEHTKQDLVKYIGISSQKIDVCLLGINQVSNYDTKSKPIFKKYIQSSWGVMPKQISLGEEQYLLFVGGVDPRRKLVELIAAFNNLRARGYRIKLILTGDTMFGPHEVPNVELQQYFKNSSYLNDVYFMGFVGEEQRDWLYRHALAFVYPSRYEGFGLPILEAMSYGTPVITYNNSSIKEVAGDAVIYAKDSLSIKDGVEQLINDPSLRKRYAQLGERQASKFSWQQTAKSILSIAIGAN